MKMGYRKFVLVLVGCFVGCGGTGPDVVPVEGVVTLDGESLANKSLMFTPIENTTGHGAGGSSDSSGKYTLKAVVPGATQDFDGIVAGRYRVTVFDSLTSGDASGEDVGDEPAVAIAPGMNDQKSNIPAIYGTDQSPIILDVPETGGVINIELNSNPS